MKVKYCSLPNVLVELKVMQQDLACLFITYKRLLHYREFHRLAVLKKSNDTEFATSIMK